MTKAEREFTRAVTEKVMGWHMDGRWWKKAGVPVLCVFDWDPLHNDTDARLLLERWCKTDISRIADLSYSYSCKTGQWSADATLRQAAGTGEMTYSWRESPHLRIAICYAVAQAVGVETGKGE